MTGKGWAMAALDRRGHAMMPQRLIYGILPPLSAAVPVLLILHLLTGCASATMEEAVPVAASPAAGQSAPVSEYPNLNIPRRGETDQLTAEERRAKAAELAEARNALQRQDAPAAGGDMAQLRRLGSGHAVETLEGIQSQQALEPQGE